MKIIKIIKFLKGVVFKKYQIIIITLISLYIYKILNKNNKGISI